MKMTWSGLMLGTMEFRAKNYMVGTCKTSVTMGLQTRVARNEVRAEISSMITSKEDADAFNDWLCKNKDKTFKLTLELDDEEEEE